MIRTRKGVLSIIIKFFLDHVKEFKLFKKEHKFPTHDDLEGAAVALARLTKTYRLNTSDLANGKIKNGQFK